MLRDSAVRPTASLLTFLKAAPHHKSLPVAQLPARVRTPAGQSRRPLSTINADPVGLCGDLAHRADRALRRRALERASRSHDRGDRFGNSPCLVASTGIRSPSLRASSLERLPGSDRSHLTRMEKDISPGIKLNQLGCSRKAAELYRAADYRDRRPTPAIPPGAARHRQSRTARADAPFETSQTPADAVRSPSWRSTGRLEQIARRRRQESTALQWEAIQRNAGAIQAQFLRRAAEFGSAAPSVSGIAQEPAGRCAATPPSARRSRAAAAAAEYPCRETKPPSAVTIPE